ncbi:MAG: transcriptional regulator [Cyanobacteria bacterium RYN_339]|nr:transcriptional regulator [Cyanobacteria bacterium RYN_339]
MPRPSLREKILSEGFHVVLERGYCGATVRDIVRAAGVPQGSFTNHFESKEAFCLELLVRYFALVQANIATTLRNDELAPLHRLRLWFEVQIDFLERAEFRNGCLIGNLSAEAGAHSATIHAKLGEIYADIHESVIYCLNAAVEAGELPETFDCNENGQFLYSSLQGAILQAKVELSPLPLTRFVKFTFSTLLR